MPASEARVVTTRADRYLAQLRSHVGRLDDLPAHAGNHGAPHPAHTPHARPPQAGADVVLDLGWGRCALRATDDALLLWAEAADVAALERIQEAIAARLQRVGHRDGLVVTWQATG
ncbi:DUF2218 domain-containing protein [Actinacidiphila acididurans]|uniref:DUF2218 domain-containing protein n=1 Tax=Actinacidiphila acididurans TaxID=2784346 RepID=A0ABS2U0G1_9ACTN|nr:DUF2218 domain-containing protein [Actinacidiphila acididurans]MBM9509079.1 DUF2218 domain-containing protein [Actinacidiphila acididurans]